jgi:very-short-patch-repair endonuclease
VARRELQAAGVTPEAIRERLRRGALIAVHRGVYRVGHCAPSLEARYMAAVKACGDRAVLSGAAAAHLWRLIRHPPPQPEVLAPVKRRVPHVLTHRALRIDSRDVTLDRGIPVTTVPRTLIDLAARLDERSLARACHEAEVVHRITCDQVESAIARRPSSPGAGTLRRILHGGSPVTLSGLEAGFLERVRDAGLPSPRTNRPVGSFRVDCRWPAERLTVELDGFRYHRSRHAWERDRQREREARARGDEFRRFTYRDVFEDPGYMLRELRTLLKG